MKPPPDWLAHIAAAAPMATKLAAVHSGEAVPFEHLVEAAQPMTCCAASPGRQRRAPGSSAPTSGRRRCTTSCSHWFSDAPFSSDQVAPMERAPPDPESLADWLGIVQRLTSAKGRQIVVLARASLEDEVPSAAALRQLEIQLKRGDRLDREQLIRQLADAGYEHVAQVSARGQFAVRGGILDVFSFHHALPVRIELFDDDIESIREFDLDSQISVNRLDTCTLLLGEAASERSTCRLRELIADKDLTIDVDASWFAARVRILEASESANFPEGSTTDDTDNSDEEATRAASSHRAIRVMWLKMRHRRAASTFPGRRRLFDGLLRSRPRRIRGR